MPAETATTDERFARVLGLERRVHGQASARIEELRYGLAFRDERLPHVPWANMLWVTAQDAVEADELVADADRMPDLDGVREVGHDDILAAEDRFLRDEPGTAAPEARRQVMAHRRHIGELLGERCFAAYAGDEVCAYAKLRHRGAIAQVEDVAVLPEHRGAGLGRLVTCAALAAGLALEPELLFIAADDEDWPKELYARLGFDPVGRIAGFLRPPAQAPPATA